MSQPEVKSTEEAQNALRGELSMAMNKQENLSSPGSDPLIEGEEVVEEALTDALASTKGHRDGRDTELVGETRTETIAWGFHQIYQFRDTFKAAGLLTDGVEHDLIQLQDQLVWLLVDTDDPLGER